MKTKSTIELQKCTGNKKRDRLLISNMEINYLSSLQNKRVLLIDPVFANWANFIKSMSIINCSTK